MENQVDSIKTQALKSITGCQAIDALEALEQQYLGRKGELTSLLKELKNLDPEQRKHMGMMTNAAKKEIEEALLARGEELQKSQFDHLADVPFDHTLPGNQQSVGRLHPLTKFIQEIEDTFLAMNFQVAEGPEIEDDYHNFTALNIPEDHPARDMQDTLWAKDIPYLLRTHTSPVQIRHMENHAPPIRIICPGRVFRKDDVDATHSPMFHQFEGLVIGTDITMAHLKGILTIALQRLIDPDIELRFRTSFFPFVEPGMEVDVKSSFHRSGWLELLGCGMVHPNVLKSVGLDPNVYQGFAFGAGIERLLMIKHQIDDIRLFYENDPRFLQQFPRV